MKLSKALGALSWLSGSPDSSSARCRVVNEAEGSWTLQQVDRAVTPVVGHENEPLEVLGLWKNQGG